MSTSWTKIADAADLAPGAPKTVKVSHRQLAVFKLGDGDDQIHVIDNRCPHEGYPLTTGVVNGEGVLTCEWHNWKFRLCDGVCVMGGDDVRRYPVRIDVGAVLVDLEDPPASEQIPPLYASLEKALFENDWGHVARTVERLFAAGESAEAVVGYGCDWAARHAPYGFDHGLAAAADHLAIAKTSASADTAVLQALNLLTEPNLRRPERTFGAPEPLPENAEVELRARIEREELAGAESLVRGAVDVGVPTSEILGWIAHAASDHFLDYGHAQIYSVKAEELLEAIGPDHAHPVLTSLVSNLVNGTREDRLPYMRGHARAMAAHLPKLATWSAVPPDPEAHLDLSVFLERVVDGALSDALEAVADALDARVAPSRIALALSVAAAERILRIDSTLDARTDRNEGWLDVTHLMTHADAARETILRRPTADNLRPLFHSARFVQHTGPLDLPPELRPKRLEVPRHDRLMDALDAMDEASAMAIARTRGTAIASELFEFATSDRATLPIFVAHQVKTSCAALRLSDALSKDSAFASMATHPLLATVRYLAHPIRERRMRRRVHHARLFVQEGKLGERPLGY